MSAASSTKQQQQQQRRGRREPWQNNERHYCELCNVWMGSDKQSILLHEQGKKHKQALEASMQQRRKNKAQQEKNAQLLQQSLQQMETAARQAHAQDLSVFASSSSSSYMTAATTLAAAAPIVSSSSYAHPASSSSHAAVAPPPRSGQNSQQEVKQERKEWQSRKKHRQEEAKRKRKKDDDDDEEEEDDHSSNKRRQQHVVKIEPGQGHYDSSHHDDGTTSTYLEGVVFGDILEEDMPVQIWLGASSANEAEKRLVERGMYWKDGLIAAVRQRPSSNNHAGRLVVDVAYLLQSSSDDADEEETLEKSVPLDRIRILLGDDRDERIPDTLEEARLLAMGGEEEEVVVANNEKQQQESIDEATGLTAWSTVSIKRTTVRQELKDERARLRQQRREAALQAEKQQKEAQARKMEEAKVANADDSALGAYDVWSQQTKEGYKGVDIHGEAKIEHVHELGKKLADGKEKVGFKKTAFKAKKKKQNRRTTTAADDDE